MSDIKYDIDFDDDAVMSKRITEAIKFELQKKKILGQPIAEYDEKTGKMYAVYPNGNRIKMEIEI